MLVPALLLALSTPATPSVEACVLPDVESYRQFSANLPGAKDPCAFYACLDRRTNGAFHADIIGYGERYCRVFAQEALPEMSAEGQRWMREVALCLMGSADEIYSSSATVQPSQDEAWAQAQKAHLDCYVDAGICELAWADYCTIAGTVDVLDLLDPRIAMTFAEIGAKCAEW